MNNRKLTPQQIADFHRDYSSTIVLVTHNIKIVTNYDLIIVLRNGTIDAVGSHLQLMQSSLYYKNLFNN